MYKNKYAFTLVELLVVVLIIGILAAVALPQYRIAVEKSRMAEAITQVRAIADAQKVYFLANGEWATSNDALDVSFSSSRYVYFIPYITWLDKEVVYAGRAKEPGEGRWYIYYYLLNDKMYCGTQSEDADAKRVCKTFGSSEEECPWGEESVRCYPIN